MSLLEGEIAAIVNESLEGANVPYDIVITRTVTTGGDPWTPGSGTTTTVNHSCRGFEDEYKAHERDGTLIQANDTRVLVLAPSIDIDPNGADSITVRGKTYAIINAVLDAAGATWIIQGRA